MYGENKLMVTIPCEEYSSLIRKSAMLDFLLSQPDDAATYRIADMVEAIKCSLAGGGKANA